MAQGATRKTTNRRSFRGVKRVGRMLLGTGVVLMMMALVGAAAWRLLELPVERVMVTGELRHVSREHLVSRVNDSLQGGFLWVDLQTIRRSLEQLPWVYRVVVKRHWPNSLEIQVFEQLPIARWSDDAYLNHTGEVFRPAQLPSQQELPLLAGPAGSELQLMQYYQLLHDPLQTVGLRLNALAMDARGGLRAELDGGGELVFGRGEVAAKLRRFLHIYQSRLAHRDGRMRSVDLRYSHGAAVVSASKDKNQKTWGEPAHG
jgi:cell division protein FtsQ